MSSTKGEIGPMNNYLTVCGLISTSACFPFEIIYNLPLKFVTWNKVKDHTSFTLLEYLQSQEKQLHPVTGREEAHIDF